MAIVAHRKQVEGVEVANPSGGAAETEQVRWRSHTQGRNATVLRKRPGRRAMHRYSRRRVMRQRPRHVTA